MSLTPSISPSGVTVQACLNHWAFTCTTKIRFCSIREARQPTETSSGHTWKPCRSASWVSAETSRSHPCLKIKLKSPLDNTHFVLHEQCSATWCTGRRGTAGSSTARTKGGVSPKFSHPRLQRVSTVITVHPIAACNPLPPVSLAASLCSLS